ncbi:hypothetical protein [Bacillus sp. FJAT-29937]|uniref:hypothetical protein n=1 Tax=Bacillus sp. FJAT-29937 TaxID=1720553 RepID=UPI00082B8460|nr:hypothetical protein [Bacillus sp. FJAT-29937]
MSSNLSELYSSRHKFKTDTIWIDWKITNSGGFEKKQIAFICLQNKDDQTEIVHPITDFIFTNWKFSSYNTQRKHALNVSSFLNYIIDKKHRLKVKSLNDLDITHGEKYLNSLTEEGKARETVKDQERTLTLFYYYLSKKECLPQVPSKTFESYFNTNGKKVHISPFKNVIFPSYSSKETEHTFPIEHLPLLFEIACLIAKPIVLGLYLQIFGGLRVGEVVNVKRSSIKHTLNGESVLINLKENMLRTDLKDTDGANYVKKPRKQSVLILQNWFNQLYNDHQELFTCSDGTSALFVNRDGKAMSAKSYRQYFDKVKKYFIYCLKNSNNINDKLLAHHLNMSKWSTHIGRGIFSNMLAEYAKNPYEIAVPRGDSSLLSSLRYLKGTTRFRKKLEERLNHMHGSYIPRLIENSKGINK